MGICYTLILLDEFDWDYTGTSKERRLKEFKEAVNKLNFYCEPIIGWRNAAVFDIHKAWPLNKELNRIIYSFCDNCYFIRDNEPKIIELERL